VRLCDVELGPQLLELLGEFGAQISAYPGDEFTDCLDGSVELGRPGCRARKIFRSRSRRSMSSCSHSRLKASACARQATSRSLGSSGRSPQLCVDLGSGK
jgi:hypothetical protein